MDKEYFVYKKRDLKIEINWSKAVTPRKKVKITLGDKHIVIPIKDFYSMMFIFSDINHRVDLIPAVDVEMVNVTKRLGIKAKKDIKEGEIISLDYTYPLPKALAELHFGENKNN